MKDEGLKGGKTENSERKQGIWIRNEVKELS
jgi:hypothetical protein